MEAGSIGIRTEEEYDRRIDARKIMLTKELAWDGGMVGPVGSCLSVTHEPPKGIAYRRSSAPCTQLLAPAAMTQRTV